MTEALNLPDMPTTPMTVDGIMPLEWQEFFRLLYQRTGGETTEYDLSELTDIVNANFITLSIEISNTYIELEYLMQAINGGHL